MISDKRVVNHRPIPQEELLLLRQVSVIRTSSVNYDLRPVIITFTVRHYFLSFDVEECHHDTLM